MYFTLSLYFLLASTFLAQDAHALPTRPGAGLLTIPFSRVPHDYNGNHPQVYLQQHINRVRRRHSRLIGRTRKSDEELRESIRIRYDRHLDFYNDVARRSDVSIANATLAANSIGLNIEANDVGYYSTIQIGTPPRNFSVTMDSGTSDLWVSGEGCHTEKDGKADGACGVNRTLLGASTSSTLVDTQKPWNITYGTGAVSGNIVKDNIVVAGIALNAHTFGIGLKESPDFTDEGVPYDGLMGLALSSASNQGTLSPPEAMAKQGLIKEAIVSYKISRAADGKGDGEITFGGMDPTKFDGSTLVTVDNVSKTGFWEANVGVIAVDGKDTGLTGRTAILDTGTTLVLAPAADAKKIHDAIPGAKSDGMGGFTLPCTSKATVSFTFGGGRFTIDPRDLVTTPVNDDDPTGDCVSGIVADTLSDDSATQWLVGDVFLKDVYFSTNVNKMSISLATLV